MIVFDTTILVYAVGSDHELRAPCRRALELARDGSVRATTTIEVVQELAHVRARRRSRADAALLARACVAGLRPLLRPDEDDVTDGLLLYERSEALGAFDAVLAAAARRRGWTIASADRAFAEVTGLDVLDPARPGFLEGDAGSL